MPDDSFIYPGGYQAAALRQAQKADAERYVGADPEILRLPVHEQFEAQRARARDLEIMALEKAGVPHQLGELSKWAPKPKRDPEAERQAKIAELEATGASINEVAKHLTPGEVGDYTKKRLDAAKARGDALAAEPPELQQLRRLAPQLFEPARPVAVDAAEAERAQRQAQQTADLARQNELSRRPHNTRAEKDELAQISQRLKKADWS